MNERMDKTLILRSQTTLLREEKIKHINFHYNNHITTKPADMRGPTYVQSKESETHIFQAHNDIILKIF